MAAIAIAKSARVNLTLAAGTDPSTGKALTENVTLNGIATNAEPTPIKNVVDLAAPCLEHPVSVITLTVVKTIEDE